MALNHDGKVPMKILSCVLLGNSSEIMSVATDPNNYEIYNTVADNINLLKMVRTFMNQQAKLDL